MADRSKIEWTDATWNPITGCSVVSPGCTNCYAMRLAGTRLRNHPTRKGLTIDSKAGPVWNGEVRLNRSALSQPLRWKAPRMIFVCAHGDLFHESVPDEWIDFVFAVMALCPQHTFQVLTKRAARMQEYLSSGSVVRRIYELACDLVIANEIQIVLVAPRMNESFAPPGRRVYLDVWPMPNVWLGISAEDQVRYNERWPKVTSLQESGWLTWLSAEPLIGPLNIDFYPLQTVGPEGRIMRHRIPQWVVVGGESGIGSRPMHPDWARLLRDLSGRARVPFFFKQWGNWASVVDRDRDDPDWRLDYQFKFADQGEHKWLNLAGGSGFHGERFHVMKNIGKRAAGRLLDDEEHNGIPGNWDLSK